MVHVAEHFQDAKVQKHAARLGMWSFLASEVLLFAGLFALYFTYRSMYRPAFQDAAHHMNLALGTLNTFVLITSSLTVALSIHAARVGNVRAVGLLLLATLAMGGVFLVIKAFEYTHHMELGIYPGVHYRFEELPQNGAKIFYTLYYFMTGLHAIHVIAGMAVLVWCWLRRASWSPAHHTGLELGAMYWHLVDLIWIFLWPILYLVD